METDDWKTWGRAYSIRQTGRVAVTLGTSGCRPRGVEAICIRIRIRIRSSGGTDAERLGSKSCEWDSLAGVGWSGRC